MDGEFIVTSKDELKPGDSIIIIRDLRPDAETMWRANRRFYVVATD